MLFTTRELNVILQFPINTGAGYGFLLIFRELLNKAVERKVESIDFYCPDWDKELQGRLMAIKKRVELYENARKGIQNERESIVL